MVEFWCYNNIPGFHHYWDLRKFVSLSRRFLPPRLSDEHSKGRIYQNRVTTLISEPQHEITYSQH